jgi:hypothetical protein
MGRMDLFSKCNFINAFKVGASGFRLANFHFSVSGNIVSLLLLCSLSFLSIRVLKVSCISRPN